MSGKFVALLLVLSCVAQGYDARASSYAETRLSIEDIVKALNELVSKIREALGGLGELIQNLEQKIKDIINAIDIPGILSEIKKKIQDIIKAAGIDTDAAAACLSEEAKAVEGLVTSTTNGATNCIAEIDGVKNELAGQIAEINSEASTLMADISSSIAKCFKDHTLNPVELYTCMKALVVPTETKVNALLDRIKDEIKAGQQLVGDAATELSTCIGKVSEDAKKQENEIVNKFQECIDAIAN